MSTSIKHLIINELIEKSMFCTAKKPVLLTNVALLRWERSFLKCCFSIRMRVTCNRLPDLVSGK
jgi:hypothetical protein